MKIIVLRLLALLILSLTVASAHEKKVGPNGGRLLTAVQPHAEFFVMPDLKVQITFIGENGKPVAPTGQVVIVTTGDRSAPTKLTFTPSGNALVSDAPLPVGNDLPTIVQIKSDPNAKAVVERFHLNFSKCTECLHPEYACTCGH
jgi:hypothetical protein